MNNKASSYLLLLSSLFLLASCGGGTASSSSAASKGSGSAATSVTSTPSQNTSSTSVSISSNAAFYTIRFLDDDGTILQLSDIEEGVLPVFLGGHPTKPVDGDTCYTFSGWDHPIVPATANATYKATYRSNTLEEESLRRLVFTYHSDTTSYSVKANSDETVSDLGEIVLPSNLDDGTNGNHPLTSIEYAGFSEMAWLQKISIPSSITSIASFAFNHCEQLTEVTFAEGLTTLDNYVFEYCYSLESIALPASLTNLGLNPFWYCNSVKSISIASENANYKTDSRSLIKISSNSLIFYANASGRTYSVPAGVVSIESMAFDGCDQLSAITLPASLISCVGFNFCPKLAKITVDSTSTNLMSDSRALYSKDQTQLYAYAEASGDSYEIPSSVTLIGRKAFKGASTLKSITFSEGLLEIEDDAFEYCINLSGVAFPSTVTALGNYAFGFCTAFTSVTLPAGLTSVSGGLFLDCRGLTSVTLPASITSIGVVAFCDCTQLNALTYEGTLADWAKVSLGLNWRLLAALTTVICSDGSITL
jgi:hypothetical protein